MGGLIRPIRRRGFCPACRKWNTGVEDQSARGKSELSPPALTALAFLSVAAAAWAWTIWSSHASNEMAMGAGPLPTFATGWVVMMAAMMLPSALPLVYEFARRSERRPHWQAATAVLGATYLSAWLAFGVLCYFVLTLVPVNLANERWGGALALALAGLYALTPIKTASEARCRELCSLHGPLPFNLVRSGLVIGARYALSCLGCSAGLMVAMLIIGMSNLAWTVVVAGFVLVYKLGPAPTLRRNWVLSALLVGLAVLYMP